MATSLIAVFVWLIIVLSLNLRYAYGTRGRKSDNDNRFFSGGHYHKPDRSAGLLISKTRFAAFSDAKKEP
jgi:hypothetical protein